MDKIGLSIQQIQVEGINLGQVTDTVSCIGNLYTYEPMLNRLIRASHCLSLFPSFFPSFLPACLPFFLLSFLPSFFVRLHLLLSLIYRLPFSSFLISFLRFLLRLFFYSYTQISASMCSGHHLYFIAHLRALTKSLGGSCEGSCSASKRIPCASFDGG